MKLVALLAWFDEDPSHLSELVESLGKAQIDHLVAVDGGYRLFPGVEAWSSRDEYAVLEKHCRCWSIDLTLHTPTARWDGNELEKRTLLFRLGHAIAEPYDDWLWVIDADEVVTRADGHREALEQTSLDVATILEYENGTPKRSERRFFRAHPKGIKPYRHHGHYVNGDDDVLWGPRQVEAVRLDVEVFHRPLARTEARNAARLDYYEARKGACVEVDVY